MSDTLLLDKKLTANQVAEMLGVNVHTIYKWARTGTIPCIKLGRHRMRFKQSDIERWLTQQTTGKFKDLEEQRDAITFTYNQVDAECARLRALCTRAADALEEEFGPGNTNLMTKEPWVLIAELRKAAE